MVFESEKPNVGRIIAIEALSEASKKKRARDSKRRVMEFIRKAGGNLSPAEREQLGKYTSKHRGIERNPPGVKNKTPDRVRRFLKIGNAR